MLGQLESGAGIAVTGELAFVELWPKGKYSKPGSWQYSSLANGKYTLYAQGHSVSETKALATEYLQRLG
ncbi:hypothetical protein FOE78_20095 [Microlunatus elymi]|uniref:Uncharacterized protein n=1 Tax=Microlunatus elymi TaxID=2596828 RepID=A0A516Q395_9ACTN|nr:hypothetical protein [Microlunatus elymi]QDP97900.1 hypothetical protein FOE78_20095 [Microlunatus elymi]